jgi:hypothetical protein
MAMKRAYSVVAVFLVVLLVACGGGGGSPDQAAKQWFEALATGDENALKDLTCAAQQESVTGVTGLLAGLGEGMGFDVSGLSFKTTEQSGETATVQVTGRMNMTFLGAEQEQEIDEAIPMVKEDGKWKVCD